MTTIKTEACRESKSRKQIVLRIFRRELLLSHWECKPSSVPQTPWSCLQRVGVTGDARSCVPCAEPLGLDILC